MPRQYRVRFTESRQVTLPSISFTASTSGGPPEGTSSHGCQQCRLGKHKCDQVYPVCIRCQRRGFTCRPAARVPQWQMVLPSSLLHDVTTHILNADQRLLRHWFERTSQILVIDPETNPFSYPLLQHLGQSAALVYAIQSLSTAHEQGFSEKSIVASLHQRQLALIMARTELETSKAPTVANFLTALLLGVSSSWISRDMMDYGRDHLCGARAILDTFLTADSTSPDIGATDAISLEFVIGCYVYWDMCCSLVADVGDLPPIDRADLISIVKSPQTQYHAVAGFLLDIFLLLAKVSRYCRACLDDTAPNPTLEAELEGQLLAWTPVREDSDLSCLGECFRSHGLIMLYRHGGLLLPLCNDVESKVELVARQHAFTIINELRKLPDNSPYICLQSLPLLTAGAELGKSDVEARAEVCHRFQGMLSINCSPTNIWAQTLLKGLWNDRDHGGFKTSWLEYMLWKGWRFSMT